MESNDYKNRTYLSAVEASMYLGITVKELHFLTKNDKIKAQKAASGQLRYNINDLKKINEKSNALKEKQIDVEEDNVLEINNTKQRILVKNAMQMADLEDNSVHLLVTSPPYFNAKMYSKETKDGDLGNVHDLEEWFEKIGQVWREAHRVLQPGRKAFINIMNLPIRVDGSHRSLNLVGRTVDVCEEIGFIFKRDIVWHKTNGVKAHFGSYPYPGGILINNMHEFILEFENPAKKTHKKYSHLTEKQKEDSKLDKEFWLTVKNSDVWLMKPHPSGSNRTHASIFPYELPYRLIKAFSFIGETVIDPFLGSGTTLEVASDLGRHGIGYEINPNYAYETIEKLTEKNSKKLCSRKNKGKVWRRD